MQATITLRPALLLAVLAPNALTAQMVSVNRSRDVPLKTPSASFELRDRALNLQLDGHMDLAAQLWQQMLMVNANSAEALQGLAESGVHTGDLPMAMSYVSRLRAVNAAEAERAASWMLQPRLWAALRQADQLRTQSRYEEATQIYRQVFGTEPPEGSWTLPFYESEAATPRGHRHAMTQLRRLHAREPHISAYAMTLGRLLTYDPESRAEGMRLLAQYPDSPGATEALQRAREWELRDAKDPVRIAGRERRFGYRALRAKDAEAAKEHFQHAEKLVANEGRTAAGLAYVAMQQQDFAEAIRFFEKARTEQVHGTAEKAGLRAARFYLAMREAGHAAERAEFGAAVQQYRAALMLRSDDPDALRGLAGVYLASSRPGEAEPVLARMTALSPGEVSGWRGLVQANLVLRGSRSAIEVESQAPGQVKLTLERDPVLAEAIATTLTEEGRHEEACERLRKAQMLAFSPAQKDMQRRLRMRYAEALTRTAKYGEAETLLRAMLAAGGESTEAWRGLLDVQHRSGHDEDALLTLDSLPEPVRAEVMAQHGTAQEAAAVYQAGGRLDAAQSLLEALVEESKEGSEGETGSAALQLAGVYQQEGRYALAAATYRRLTRLKVASVAAWTGLFSVLHAAGEDKAAIAEMETLPPETKAELEETTAFLIVEASALDGTNRSSDAYAKFERLEAVLARSHSVVPSEVLLQQVWLQYKLGLDQTIGSRLAALRQRQDLLPEQQLSSNLLLALCAVRTAEVRGNMGDLVAAQRALDAAARALPAGGAAARVLGGAYMRAGAPEVALRSFISEAPVSAPEYRVAIGAALASSRFDLAKKWLASASVRYPGDGTLSMLAANMDERQGEDGRAVERLRAALDPQRGLSDADRTRAAEELTSLEGRYSTWSGTEAQVRRRTGRPGLDQLLDVETPVAWSVTYAEKVRLGITSAEVLLNSGSRLRGSTQGDLGGADAEATLGGELGTGVAAQLPAWVVGQSGRLHIATRNVTLSVGYTPYGFPVSHVAGQFEYTRRDGHVNLFARQEPVRDTRLSYAGLYDRGSGSASSPGKAWGGVVATGAGARVNRGSQQRGWYGEAAVSRLSGQHVKSNVEVHGIGGAYWRVSRPHVPGRLTAGANLSIMHYAHNERALTYGNGGYFSPQSYMLASLPLRWEGDRSRRWSYAVTAAIGAQHIRESRAALFPLDPGLRRLAERRCAPDPTGGSICHAADLAASTSSGANFDVAGQFAYRVNPHWMLSGAFSTSNSSGYTQVQSGVGLRYFFRRQATAKVEAGDPLQSNTVLPLRLP